MLTVHLIRHAESESNAGLPTSHPSSTPLTEKGLAQARQTALAFDSAPSLIAHSPYIRTRQTAQPLMERFPTVGVAEWPVQEFTYLAPANWDGTTIEERRPAVHAYWERGDPFYVDGAGAESFAGLLERVRQTHQLIAAQPAGDLVVFSHGEFLRAFLWTHLHPLPEPSAENMRRFRQFCYSFRFPNCGILKFLPEGSGWFSSLNFAHLASDLLTM
jgi:2,3-bisphosphoglycerate-dependent phosphoglycerate mutase